MTILVKRTKSSKIRQSENYYPGATLGLTNLRKVAINFEDGFVRRNCWHFVRLPCQSYSEYVCFVVVIVFRQSKSQVSSLEKQLNQTSHQLLIEKSKCNEIENKFKVREVQWKMEKATLEEKLRSVITRDVTDTSDHSRQK